MVLKTRCPCTAGTLCAGLLAAALLAGGLLGCAAQRSSGPGRTEEATAGLAAREESAKPEAESPKTLSAVQVVEALRAAGLPVGRVIVYNAENDPNKLLGRSGQYTEKVSWEDTRLEQTDPEDPEGGTVEVFAKAEDLAARRSYLEQVTKATPMFQQYMYEAGNVLLRVSFDLTPDQAKEYEAVLRGLAQY